MITLNDSAIFSRIEILYGKKKLENLKKLTIAVFGIGGVGGAAVELLCRSGIKNIIICDYDTVQPSNLNRQILFNKNDIGKLKTEAAESKIKSINPDCNIYSYAIKLNEKSLSDNFKNTHIDFAVDAIDSLNSKTELIIFLLNNQIKFISSMGAGGKTDITKIKIDYLENTYNCRLSAVLKKKLRKKINILNNIPVVYSDEPRTKPATIEVNEKKKQINGTIAHITNTFGAYCADYFFKSTNF